MNMVEREVCKKIHAIMNNITVTSRMVCAKVPGEDTGSCTGDGGRAMVIKRTGMQVGIASWGDTCLGTRLPGVYVNVAYKEIHDFIDGQLKELADSVL